MLIPHRAIARVADHNGHAVVLPDDCFLQTSPYSFAASTTEIWLSLLHGARLVVPAAAAALAPRAGPADHRTRVTFLNLPCGLFNLRVDATRGAGRGALGDRQRRLPVARALSRALRASAARCTTRTAVRRTPR
ncbi:AMP-binding protein [Streptomyces sp. DSM 41037]|uniref:AMP-binding protein n=1 Tax=Streptomyces sp. DSM 41037 TaxID=2817710 RepID=UPI00358E6477